MRYASVIALLVLSSFPAPAFSQQAMKMGDKDWVALEKVLDDVNNQWLCAGKYYKAKRQDCVDFRAKYWADQFFEVGQSGKTQVRNVGHRRRTAHGKRAAGECRGCGDAAHTV